MSSNKSAGVRHTAFTQPPLNRYFIPRPIPAHFEPTFKYPRERPEVEGVGQYIKYLLECPPPIHQEHMSDSPKEDGQIQCRESMRNKMREWLSSLNNHENDPRKTLFICRMDYSVSERDLRKIYQPFGPLRSVKIIEDMNHKPRGYAFVEFEHERDMRKALHRTDGIRVNGKKILVDIERARTMKNWIPRRLGGGLGHTRPSKSRGIARKASSARTSLL